MADERNEYEIYIDSKIKEIRSKLVEYMDREGIERTSAGMFSCPNKTGHKNADSTPSAHLIAGPEGHYWYCHTCKARSDVISMAHYHEGLADRGADFISKTIPSLCSKLEIKWDPESAMTPEMKELHLLYRANEILAKKAVSNLTNMMANNPDSPIVSFVQKRGLTDKEVITHEVGYLEIDDAIAELSHLGLTTPLLRELGLDRNSNTAKIMFSESGVIFVLRSAADRVVGFASRNINHGTPGNSGPKYINTHNNRIFEKKRFLYGLNLSKTPAQEKRNIYVYEGYLDVITSSKLGIANCCAICSSSFTEDQLKLIYKNDISSVTFALDGDKAGSEGVMNAMEKLFITNKMVMPFVIEIPGEHDPDSYMQAEGSKAFALLKRMNLIEYKIHTTFEKAKTNEMLDVEEEIEVFFRWIINYEPNPIKRLKCLKILSEYTGHSTVDLRRQIEYQSQMMSDEVAGKVDSIWYDMVNQGRSVILKERIAVLDAARAQLTSMVGQTNVDLVEDQMAMVTDMEKDFRTNTVQQVKFGWPKFDENILIPKDASLVMVGAYPNVGKSIMMRNIALNVLMHNPDMGVIYFSMDDPMKATLPGLVAKLKHVAINDIRFQNTIAQSKKTAVLNEIQSGFQQMKNFMKSERFAIFDQSDVISMGDIETMIDIAGDKMAKHGKKPIVIVDSLHSITMSSGMDRRLEVMSHIRDLRRIANVRYIPVIGVAELRKGQSKQGAYRRPSLRDFSETGDIEYRVTVGMILENELKEKGPAHTVKKWRFDTVTPNPLPILTVHVDKNKEGFFQGELNYETNPIWSEMTEMTDAKVIAMNKLKEDNVTSVNDIDKQPKSSQKYTPQTTVPRTIY